MKEGEGRCAQQWTQRNDSLMTSYQLGLNRSSFIWTIDASVSTPILSSTSKLKDDVYVCVCVCLRVRAHSFTHSCQYAHWTSRFRCLLHKLVDVPCVIL